MNLNHKFEKGDLVRVKAYPNQILERRVVGTVDDKKVLLCNEDEFNAALADNREPTSIGFPVTDVIINDHEQ
jgi:hypothetical protein